MRELSTGKVATLREYYDLQNVYQIYKEIWKVR